MPGEQFTRGAGVSKEAMQRRPRATRSDGEAAVLFCGLSAVLVRACGADQAMQRAAALRNDESMKDAVGALRSNAAAARQNGPSPS